MEADIYGYRQKNTQNGVGSVDVHSSTLWTSTSDIKYFVTLCNG